MYIQFNLINKSWHWRTRKCWTYNTIECSQRIIMTSIDSCPFSAADVSFAFFYEESNKKDHMFGVEHDILVVCICFEVILLYHKVKLNWYLKVYIFGCGKMEFFSSQEHSQWVVGSSAVCRTPFISWKISVWDLCSDTESSILQNICHHNYGRKPICRDGQISIWRLQSMY